MSSASINAIVSSVSINIGVHVTQDILSGKASEEGAFPFRNAAFYVHNPIGRTVIQCNSACTGLVCQNFITNVLLTSMARTFHLQIMSAFPLEISFFFFLTPIIHISIQSY